MDVAEDAAPAALVQRVAVVLGVRGFVESDDGEAFDAASRPMPAPFTLSVSLAAPGRAC
jgi:hypothetical protein